MMLWLCLKLNRLSIEVLSPKNKNSIALAIISNEIQAKVVAFNEKAKEIGIKKGMTLSTLNDLTSEIQIHRREKSKEELMLEAIANWSLKFTSQVTICQPDSLLLEIGGSLKLFRGIDNIVKEVSNYLSRNYLTHDIAVAPTPLGAQYLANQGINAVIRNIKSLSETLKKMPISVFDNSNRSISILSKIGIYYFFELEKLPKESVKRRFGSQIFENFEKAVGRLPDPQEKFIPSKKYSISANLPFATQNYEIFFERLKSDLKKTINHLLRNGIQPTKIKIILSERNKIHFTKVIFIDESIGDANHLISRISNHLNQINISKPLDSVIIQVNQTRIINPESKSILSVTQSRKSSKTPITQVIKNRLGEGSIFSLCPISDYRPELAWYKTEPGEDVSASTVNLIRPFWLLPVPRKIKYQNNKLWIKTELSILEGPERIESGWWDNQEVRRDYFIAINRKGSLFWIYREFEKTKNWYLHGIFS